MAQALKDLTIQVSNNEKRLKNTMSHFAFIYTFSMTRMTQKMMTMEAVGSSVHNASVHLPSSKVSIAIGKESMVILWTHSLQHPVIRREGYQSRRKHPDLHVPLMHVTMVLSPIYCS